MENTFNKMFTEKETIVLLNIFKRMSESADDLMNLMEENILSNHKFHSLQEIFYKVDDTHLEIFNNILPASENTTRISPEKFLDDMELEALALTQFNGAGDDGLFPNHSDRDIWVDGFIKGYTYFLTHKFKK